MGNLLNIGETEETKPSPKERIAHREKVKRHLEEKKDRAEVREVELKNRIRSVQDFKSFMYDEALGLSPAKIKRLKKELRSLFPEFARAATKDVVWMDEFLIAVEGGDRLYEPKNDRLVVAKT